MFHKSFLSNHLSVFNSEAATGGVLSGVCFGGFRGVHWGVPVVGSPFLIELQALGLLLC